MTYNNKRVINNYMIVEFPDNKIFSETSSKKAANNAFSYLLQFMDIDNSDDDFFLGKFLVFVIKNTKTNKEYKYIGNRIKLKNPVKNGNNIYYYKNVIGKYKKELDLI